MTDTTAAREKLDAWAADKPPVQMAAKLACIMLYLLEDEDDPKLRGRLAETMEFIREHASQ